MRHNEGVRLVVLCGVVAVLGCGTLAEERRDVRRVSWNDVSTVHRRLEAHGITARSFPSYVERIREENLRRIRDGDFDHLIFYLLQSRRFTALPPVEPALSAKAFVESLAPQERQRFLSGTMPASRTVPENVRSRIDGLLRTATRRSSDSRLSYFSELIATAFPDQRRRKDALMREYLRVMRFVYEKEFVAQKSARSADAVAELYRDRGLSTDTAVEAGYLVYQGLGVVKALDPARRIRRVLIVGPGLDLAPRTGLVEDGPAESYQPWAVIDALLAFGLSRPGELEVVAADINPRVVEHLRRSVAAPPTLTLVTGLQETASVTFTQEYRDYFAGLGSAIGEVGGGSAGPTPGALRKSVRVRREAIEALRPVRLDLVTERLAARDFDLAIATNILPYFGDLELMLAMSNVAGMLAPGGVFLHNEPRPPLGEITNAVGLPFNQLRQATIATVRNGPPLVDTVFVHTKAAHTGDQRPRP